MPLRFPQAAQSAYQYPLTLRHLLSSALFASADQEIIYRDQVRYTYRDLPTRIGKLASMLRALGAEQGTTVAVMDWDSHRYLEAYFGVPMMGAVLQTVNVRLPAAQVSYTLCHAEAEILLVHRDFFPLVEAMLPELATIKTFVAIMDGSDDPAPSWAHGTFESLFDAAPSDFDFEDFDENALATTFYTTGTTGNPKGVAFTHRQLVLQALSVNGPFGASTRAPAMALDDVYMPLTPMFHVNAWGMPYVATMLGVKQVYPGRYEPDLICRLRTEHKVSFSHCVPTVLRMILDSAAKSGASLDGWKLTIGGSALSRPLYLEASARGMKLVAGYGMSETCPVISVSRLPASERAMEPEEQADYMCAAGVPIPLVQVRIVDDNMNDVPRDGNARGEIVVRSPWLTMGYVGNPEGSEELWLGGWLHTQDVATVDPSGYIRIRDRLKDVVKSGGEWIDSLHLEELVAKADGVSEVAVIAVPDPRWGERPLAIVLAAADETPDLSVINGHIAEEVTAGRISRYAKLERLELVGEMPRTSVGKCDKKALRAMFATPASSDPSA